MRAFEFLNENLGMPYPGTYEQEFTESADSDERTASELAKELHQDLIDMQHIIKSQSKINAGNPHNMESLRRAIIMLAGEIEDLGYEYDPNSPGMIRKLQGRIFEKWSQKYKRSIDCSHPKGFSQKAHCQGRKKK